jgi:hypothetical protein
MNITFHTTASGHQAQGQPDHREINNLKKDFRMAVPRHSHFAPIIHRLWNNCHSYQATSSENAQYSQFDDCWGQ